MPYKKSYHLHNEWYNKHFPSEHSKTELYTKVKSAGEKNIAYWLQQVFFKALDPLLDQKNHSWLTVGDAYGFDAQYIEASNNKALATDLNIDFLTVALREGIVTACAAENAEKLSFDDNYFDYVLCKESYHHFPRPYAAMYEMIRVARSAVVIIEPNDPVSKMPGLLMLNNILSSNGWFLRKIWKNRFSYEPVGNFVYKVSEREFEKLAAGLGLQMVAFKKINPNFWFKDADQIQANNKSSIFMIIKIKKYFLDLLVKMKLIPSQVLATIIFKQLPDKETINLLKTDGYDLVNIPENPYIV